MNKLRNILTLALTLSAILISQQNTQAQTAAGQNVNFTISPAIFQQGQSQSTFLCMSPSNTAGALGFDQNDVIGFTFDSNIGTVTSIDSPVFVRSSTLSASDFNAHPNAVNPNKIVISYINAT
jgi:hypothetical protein